MTTILLRALAVLSAMTQNDRYGTLTDNTLSKCIAQHENHRKDKPILIINNNRNKTFYH